MNLQRRIWLTGASSGIGLALAEQLAAQGHRVAMTARRREPLLALAERYPDQVLVVTADLTDIHAVREAAERIDTAWGGLDWAILNAGTCEYMELPHFSAAPAFRTVYWRRSGSRTTALAIITGAKSFNFYCFFDTLKNLFQR